jgi:tRNA(Ile)-lysidine synthase
MGEKVALELRVGQALRSAVGTDGVVIALSGGPDSVALAVAAAATHPADVPLVLAHLNHQLRGADSDADEQFVIDLHARLAAGTSEVRLTVDRLDVGALARQEGENLEALARRERYRWLAAIARRERLHWVATGHTANDQAETVLHRILRGTGLQGLRGIAPRRPLEGDINLVRPLLTTTRAEVLAYLAGRQQPYREDATNQDLERTRNRLRHDLLPRLAQDYNPAIISVLGRLAAHAEETFALLEAEGRALLEAAELPRAGALVILDRDRLAAAAPQRVREVFRQLWAREGWPMGEMDHDAWSRLADLPQGGASAVDLPGGVRARRRGSVIQVGAAR